MIILWILGILLATIWIWLPILIVVLVVRANKKKPQPPVGQPYAAPPVMQYPDQNAVRREELNQQIYDELKKEKPSIGKMRGILKMIEGLAGGSAQSAAIPEYSYEGAGPDDGHRAMAAAPFVPQVASVPTSKVENHSGLNAILYIGSLLVVAGVGTLVVSMVEDSVKMIVMLIIIAIFFVGGLLVRRDERLVVAGKALVGTALAIIPFLGFGFAGFLDIPAEFAWLLTSAIGLAAYVVATIELKSKVIAFMSMAFLISLCLSMSATLALPMLYYFMLVMLVGVVAGLVRLFAGKKVPELFSAVVDVTGTWLTPMTLVASLMFAGVADGQMYVWLFWLAAAQSAIVWFDKKKLAAEILFRVLAHAAVLVTCLEIFSGDAVAFGVVWLLTAVVHGFISLMLGALVKGEGRTGTEWGMQIAMMVVAQFAVLFVLVGGEATLASLICLFAVLYVGVGSGISAFVYKKVGWLYGVLAALVVLPWVFGGWVLDGGARWGVETYYIVYLVMMALVVLMRGLVGKKDGVDALGLVGVMAFGWIAVGCSAVLEAGYMMLGMALFAVAVGVYGWLIKSKVLYEVAVYIGALTLCRVVSEMLVSMDADGWGYILAYAHIIALALIGMSVWRERGQSKIRLGFAMGVLTFAVGTRALGGGSEMAFYAMWFLLMNVIFVVGGGLWKKKWIWVWGACGVGAAIMWFLKDLAFIWLILIGFGLIALVVWSLLKGQKK